MGREGGERFGEMRLIYREMSSVYRDRWSRAVPEREREKEMGACLTVRGVRRDARLTKSARSRLDNGVCRLLD